MHAHKSIFFFYTFIIHPHVTNCPFSGEKKPQQIKQIIRGLSHEPHNLPVQAISVSISVDLNFIFHN